MSPLTAGLLALAGQALIFWLIHRNTIKLHKETLRGIYFGYGAPDENGNVGWYRDNRYGSPFINADSPWAEGQLANADSQS